jgi:hypothetical protein
LQLQLPSGGKDHRERKIERQNAARQIAAQPSDHALSLGRLRRRTIRRRSPSRSTNVDSFATAMQTFG